MVNVDMPFDIWDLFVNEIVGDLWLFIFIGIAIIIFVALRNQMPFQVSTMLVAIFLLIIVSAVSTDLLFVLVIFGIGAFLYFQFKTIF